MAMKTGVSHSSATLLLTIVGTLLTEYLRHLGVFRHVFEFLEMVSVHFSSLLRALFNLNVRQDVLVPAVVASLLAFLWGVVFHLIRYRD